METELVDLCSLRDPVELQVEQLELLVNHPDCPDINKKDENNLTPLDLLCEYNSSTKLKRCLQILLKTNTEKEGGPDNTLEQQYTAAEPSDINKPNTIHL